MSAAGERAERLERAVRRGGSPALICYVPLGDPAVACDVPAIYAAEGVDVLEVGVPAPTPALDGPTVGSSMARALAAGVDADRASQLIRSLRERLPDQAMVWMSYASAVEPGWREAVLASGADGVLLPGRAMEQEPLARELERADVAYVHFLGSPRDDRDVAAARAARGFVMLQARPGPTGPGGPAPELEDDLRSVRAAGVGAPLAVGFGVRDGEDARRMARLGVDGIVVGSAMVEAALDGEAALRRLVRALREGLDDR